MDFSLEQITVILNGHTVKGFSDATDAFSVPTVTFANVVRGADGRMVSVSTGDKGGPLVIKLLPNSPSVPFFMNAISAQLLGASITWYGLYRDSQNGISVGFTNGVLQIGPVGQTLGKGAAANQEFTFEFERIIPSYLAANFS